VVRFLTRSLLPIGLLASWQIAIVLLVEDALRYAGCGDWKRPNSGCLGSNENLASLLYSQSFYGAFSGILSFVLAFLLFLALFTTAFKDWQRVSHELRSKKRTRPKTTKAMLVVALFLVTSFLFYVPAWLLIKLGYFDALGMHNSVSQIEWFQWFNTVALNLGIPLGLAILAKRQLLQKRNGLSHDS